MLFSSADDHGEVRRPAAFNLLLSVISVDGAMLLEVQ